MIAIWLFIKSFVTKLIPYTLKFWREILIAAMFLLWQHEKSSHSDTVQELATLKQDIELKTKEKQIEDAIKLSQATKEIESSRKVHAVQLELVKDVYEKRNKVNVNTIANLRDQLRERVRSDNFTIPETKSNTERTSEEWRDSYTTLAGRHQDLRDACTLTTSDYNHLRNWADTACNQIGCEE